jgi:hypothetical protein
VSVSPLAFVTDALLRRQWVLHLLVRHGVRLWIIVSPLEGWTYPALIRVLAAVFMVYDVVLAWALRRGAAPPLWARWLLDVADATTWALLHPAAEPYSGSVGVAGPVLAVTAIQRGVLSAAIAGIGLCAVVSAARLAVDSRPFTADALLYTSVSIALGVILKRVLVVEVQRQCQRADTLAEADRVAAVLAGRNDVITGGDADTIDEVQTLLHLLSGARIEAADILRTAVGGHKQALGDQTRIGAVYLRDALDTIAAEARAHEPAVSRHVFFDIPRDAGVCVLSRHQADQLAAGLSAAGSTGFLPVHVTRYRMQGTVVVEIGGHHYTLTSQRLPIRLTLTPVATAGLVIYILLMSNGTYTAVPLYLTIPLAVAVLAYAVAGLALTRHFGRRIEPWLAIGTLGPFALTAVVSVNTASPAGPPRLVLGGLLIGLALVLGTVVSPRVAVLMAWSGLGVAAAAAVWTSSGLPIRLIASELTMPLVAFLGAHLTTRAVMRISGDLSDRLTRDRIALAADARRSAASQEVNYLLDVSAQGEALCASAEPGPIRTQVSGELRRLGDQLRTRNLHTG